MSLTHPTSTGLSPARRRLIAIMRDLRFGQIRDLHIVAGDPVFYPAPRLVRAVQLGAADHPRGGHAQRITPHIVELLNEFDALGSGLIEVIKVQDGLPIHVQVAVEDLPAA